MKNFYNHLMSKVVLLFLLFSLFIVVCFGQNERELKCKDKEYYCRVNNYVGKMAVQCKGKGKDYYDCSIAEYTKIVDANPNDLAAYFVRGQTFLIRNPNRAVLDFNKALELDQNYLLTYIMLGLAYKKMKDYDQAIAVLSKAVELDSKYISAYESRGNVYLDKQDFEKALADFNKEIELAPKATYGYINRARVYETQRNFEKAIAEYNKTIEISPNYWIPFYSRGYLYWKQGEKAKADADCQKAKELIELDFNGMKMKPRLNEYCSL